MATFIQVYTGDGKGKTTAALGLALRAAGHGRRVYIGQFMKGQYYGELTSLKNVPGIEIEQFGDEGCFHRDEMTGEHKAMARQGLDRIRQKLLSDSYDLVIFDEICVALWFGLVEVDDLMSVLREKPDRTEIVLTGRKAPEEVIAAADLVTEMVEVKHYYQKGVLARDAIER